MIAALCNRLAAVMPPRRQWPAMIAGYALIAAAYAAVITAKLP